MTENLNPEQNIYEQRLRAVLDVVQRYLPPDGIDQDVAMSEIIGLVDPWPTARPQPQAEVSEERTPKDYAIEHAGYMATAAQDYLEAVGNFLFAQIKDDEEGTRATSDAVDEARDALVDAGLTLSNRIHGFETRRDRALERPNPHQARAVLSASCAPKQTAP